MTLRTVQEEPDFETNSGIIESLPHGEASFDANVRWVPLTDIECWRGRREMDESLVLHFPFAVTDTSTPASIPKIQHELLGWWVLLLTQYMDEALLSSIAACQPLAKVSQANLLDVSGAWTDLEISFGQEAIDIVRYICDRGHFQTIKCIQPDGMEGYQESVKFLSRKVPGLSPLRTISRLIEMAQESFPGLVSLSFKVIEDPEVVEEQRACMLVYLNESAEEASLQYRRYVSSLRKEFPPSLRRWFVTDVNFA